MAPRWRPTLPPARFGKGPSEKDPSHGHLADGLLHSTSPELVQFVAKVLAAERRRRGTPRGSRALTCFWQAVLGLRWFRDRTTPDALARDHKISRATAYRYRDEVIDVLVGQAPGLIQALQRARAGGCAHVILDGTVIACGT